jgi:hypothetical protein
MTSTKSMSRSGGTPSGREHMRSVFCGLRGMLRKDHDNLNRYSAKMKSGQLVE